MAMAHGPGPARAAIQARASAVRPIKHAAQVPKSIRKPAKLDLPATAPAAAPRMRAEPADPTAHGLHGIRAAVPRLVPKALKQTARPALPDIQVTRHVPVQPIQAAPAVLTAHGPDGIQAPVPRLVPKELKLMFRLAMAAEPVTAAVPARPIQAEPVALTAPGPDGMNLVVPLRRPGLPVQEMLNIPSKAFAETAIVMAMAINTISITHICRHRLHISMARRPIIIIELAIHRLSISLTISSIR